MNCSLDGCGRAIEHGDAVHVTGRPFHPGCVVRILLSDRRAIAMFASGRIGAQGDLFPMGVR